MISYALDVDCNIVVSNCDVKLGSIKEFETRQHSFPLTDIKNV